MPDRSLTKVPVTTAATRRSAPTLRLFDGFRLEYESSSVTISLNGQRLLAFLALHGNATRSDSAGRLWPEAAEARANGNLRTTIWRLNRCGIRLLESCGRMLTLARDVYVDVRAFIEAASRIEQFVESDMSQMRILDGGELLPGWYEDWVLFERERLRQIRLHSLETLAGQLTSRERYAQALDAALLCVNLDPLRESAHQAVLTIHLAERNVAEAIRHYEFFRQLLHDELGIEPSPQLRNMLPEEQEVSLQYAPRVRHR